MAEQQERKKIQLKPIPLNEERQKVNVQVQAKIISESQEDDSKSGPDNAIHKRQGRGSRKDRTKSTNQVGKYPSFNFEFDESTMKELTECNGSVRSIKILEATMEHQIKGLDGFIKENPIMDEFLKEIVGHTKAKLAELAESRRDGSILAENIMVQKADKDLYEMKKRELIHECLREVEEMWHKLIEIETKGMESDRIKKYLHHLNLNISKKMQTVRYEEVKKLFEDCKRESQKHFREKLSKIKALNEAAYQIFVRVNRKIYQVMAIKYRVQRKLALLAKYRQAKSTEKELWEVVDCFDFLL